MSGVKAQVTVYHGQSDIRLIFAFLCGGPHIDPALRFEF